MSAITVRTMLAVILENNLKMDDEIGFCLSDETFQHESSFFDIDHVRMESVTIIGRPEKRLNFVFDLNDMTEEE